MTPLRIAAAAIAVLACLVFANAHDNGFALDDEFIILHNEDVHGIDRLDDALTSPYWPQSPGRLAMYRPLTSASFALEWDLWGVGRVTGFHVTNILLHAAVSVLVLLLLHRLAGLGPAVAGAALFAVHPVHVEAVANLVGRGELLAAFFFLLAAVLYLRAPTPGAGAQSGAAGRAPGPRRWLLAAGIAGLYFLALASKEIGVTLPAVLLLLEAARGTAGGGGGVGAAAGESAGAATRWLRRVRARWPVYAGVVASLGGYLVLRALELKTLLGNSRAPYLATESVLDRVLTAISVWPEYARLLVFPADLSADYSPAVLLAQTTVTPAVVAGVLTGAAAAALAALSWRRAPLVAVGIGWFAITIAPVSNLLFPVEIMLAERTLYLPSVGLALGAAGGVRMLLDRHREHARALALAGAVVLVLGAVRTWTRTPVWEDTGSVLSSLAADHPESFRVQWVLGAAALRQGRTEEGLARFRAAVAMMPSHYQLRFQYGRALLAAGREDDAVTQLSVARRLTPEHPEAHILLAHALQRLGRSDEAVRAAEKAVKLFPDHRGAWHQLAVARAALGDLPGALTAREASLRLAGSSAHWRQRVHAAELQLRLGRPAAAVETLERARARAPAAPIPSLATLRAAIERGDTAVLPYR